MKLFQVKAEGGHLIYPQDLLRKAGETHFPEVDFEVLCEPLYEVGKPHWAFDNYRCGGAVGYNPSHLFYTQPGWGKHFEEMVGRNKVSCVTYACDPELHQAVDVEQVYDVGFVGQCTDLSGEREEYLKAIQSEFNCFIADNVASEHLSETLSRCKVLFNHIRYEEINIRFFESLAIGAQVVSHSPALDLITSEGQCYLTFKSIPEAIDKIKLLLKSQDKRKRMAKNARKAALLNTYKHRAEQMLRFTGHV